MTPPDRHEPIDPSAGDPAAPAIQALGLSKSYGQGPVLAGLDLAVPRGSVFALLGPNGAGKATTVRILSTLITPDAGQARVAGFDIVSQRRQVRRSISLTGQYAAVDELQTGAENLRMMGALAGLPRAAARRRTDELLSRFDLVEAGHRRVATYSGGMRRRLDLAAGLLVPPAVMFLDEPTTGLDPRSRQQMWQVISDLGSSGVTVFLTTQYLEEADRLADRIAIIDGGRMVAEGTAEQLKHRVAGQRLDLTLSSRSHFDEVHHRLGSRAGGADRDRLEISTPIDGGAAAIRALLDELDPDRTAIDRFAVHSATLDDVFLALTGHPTRSTGPETPVALKENANV